MTEITDLDRAESYLTAQFARGTNLSVAAQQEISKALHDARLWRALMDTARFRIQGSAGLEVDGSRTPGSNYVHFGMELWSAYKHDGAADAENARARNMLTALAELTLLGSDAEAAIEAEKVDKKQRMDAFCLILAKDIRALVRVLPQVGLYEAIALCGRPDLDPERTVNYLQHKGLIASGEPVTDKMKLTERGNEVRRYLLDEFNEATAEM